MLENVVVRRGILAAVKKVLPNLHGTILDVGCGYQPYKNLFMSGPSSASRYLGMDYSGNQYLGNTVDIVWDGLRIPLPANSVDCAIATEFFEHCSSPDIVLAEISRVLKPGGMLMLTVPFLYPLHEVPNDFHRYTPFTLDAKLTGAGFADIQLEALGGSSAALAIMIGLWVGIRVTRRSLRMIASIAALPIIRWLHFIDTAPTCFSNMTMITGVAAVARKSSFVI